MEAAPPLALAYWCRCPRGCNRAGNGDCCYCDLCYHDGTWCKCNCEGCRAPAPPSFTVQESWDAYGEEDCDGVVLDRRAMDSAGAGRCGASQPAADRSPTLGTSRSASGARLVQHPLERRQARDGGWYTMQEFKQYYRSFSAWRWHWDTAVLPVVPPSVLLSAVALVPRIESAGQRLESRGTPPLKVSDAEEEDLEEAATRKPWMGNLASSSYSPSTRNNNAHLDTIAEDMVRTKAIKCE